MPPLLVDFIHARICKLKCEKFVTRPSLWFPYSIKKLARTCILMALANFLMYKLSFQV